MDKCLIKIMCVKRNPLTFKRAMLGLIRHYFERHEDIFPKSRFEVCMGCNEDMAEVLRRNGFGRKKWDRFCKLISIGRLFSA